MRTGPCKRGRSWSADHVEPGLDEPVGYRVQRKRRLAHTGGYTRTGGHSSRWGYRRRDSAARSSSAARQLDDESVCASDSLWLQAPSTAPIAAFLPWGRTRPASLIRIVDTVAREVIAASDSGTGPLGLTADQLQRSVKNFAIALGSVERVGIDGKLDRRGACMDLSPCGRACPPARHVAEGVQHLSPVLQGMRGAVYRAPVTWRSDPAPMPSTRARSQFISSRSQLFRSSTLALAHADGLLGCFEPLPDFAEVTSCQCRPDSQELFRLARCH